MVLLSCCGAMFGNALARVLAGCDFKVQEAEAVFLEGQGDGRFANEYSHPGVDRI